MRRNYLGLMLLAMVSLAVGPIAVLAGGQGGAAGVTPAGTAFTYQGQLIQGGVPVNSTCDFEFSLWDAAIGPTQVGLTLAVNNVTIADGLFTVQLDFGAASFNGNARWLEIAVRCPAGAGVFTTLTPRQPLTPAPYAVRSLAPWAISPSTKSDIYYDAGNVGVGTTDPLARLHVHGDGTDKLLLRGQLSAPFLHFRKNVNGSDWILRHDDGRLHFQTEPPPAADKEVLTIHSSKRLGIGNTAPAFPLHVGTNATNGNGAHVTIGGVWTNASDRNSKKNFTPVDRKDILAKVADLPIGEWQYKGEPDSVRHIGPVAQDFYVAFGLGHSDRHIGTIDADGVALAAIQELHQQVQEKDCQIEALHEEIVGMSERLARLESLFPKPGIQETGGTP